MSNLPVPQGSLSAYLVEINKFPLLKPEEERECARRFQEQGDVEAAHKLVTSNLRFVVKIAYEYSGYGIRIADLIQEGNIGLMHAVKRFDPRKGVRFLSYAVWWIRATIQNFILKSWSLVKIGTTKLQRKFFHKIPHDISLDEPLSEENPTTRLDRMTASDNQEEELARAEERSLVKTSVQKALTRLNPRERFIVEHRLMSDEPATLQEIGTKYNISRERARQLEAGAKQKIRVALAQ